MQFKVGDAREWGAVAGASGWRAAPSGTRGGSRPGGSGGRFFHERRRACFVSGQRARAAVALQRPRSGRAASAPSSRTGDREFDGLQSLGGTGPLAWALEVCLRGYAKWSPAVQLGPESVNGCVIRGS